MKSKLISPRHLCAECRVRRTAFDVRGDGRYRAMDDHDLCSRCLRVYQAGLRRWREANTLDGWML